MILKSKGLADNIVYMIFVIIAATFAFGSAAKTQKKAMKNAWA